MAAGAPADTPIVGTQDGRCMTRQILADRPEMDFAACRLDMIDAGKAMMRQHSDVGAIVLECTNMAPYARDLRKVTGLPVYSIYSFISWFQSGLQPRRFDLELDDPRYV